MSPLIAASGLLVLGAILLPTAFFLFGKRSKP